MFQLTSIIDTFNSWT